MRIVAATACLALIGACGERPIAYDALFFEHEGAAFIGAGSGVEAEAGLLCEPGGDSDWPPLTVYMVLPETGETLVAGEGVATVDGREVPLRLTMKIDGREIKLSDFWVQQHEELKRAIVAGGVEDGEDLAKALERAKSIEFGGDGRRLKINVQRAEARGAFADMCRAAAKPGGAAQSQDGPVATNLAADEIEAAVTQRWRTGDAAFEKNGLRYRVVTAVASPLSLPPDAASRGIKAYPGIGLEGESAPFATVMVAYAVFDDPAAADAYFSDADFNLGEQEVAEIKSFRIERDGYPVVAMNCVYVPDSGNSVNCHYKTPDKRIVAMLLLAEGPMLDFSGNERAIDLVFADEAAADRASLAASASWAYLFDAVYR
ncbi:MAG: hypothetical protein HXY21_00085 [Parvularculaceae bacterium]|nr:hypothetical protein [Parvularculaceae bacterium]